MPSPGDADAMQRAIELAQAQLSAHGLSAVEFLAERSSRTLLAPADWPELKWRLMSAEAQQQLRRRPAAHQQKLWLDSVFLPSHGPSLLRQRYGAAALRFIRLDAVLRAAHAETAHGLVGRGELVLLRVQHDHSFEHSVDPSFPMSSESLGWGVFAGFDWSGRPIVRGRQQLRAAQHDEVWVLRPSDFTPPPPAWPALRGLDARTEVAVSGPVQEVFDALLDVPVNASGALRLSLRDYAQWLDSRGLPWAIVGGAVRDVCQKLSAGQGAASVVAQVTDLDVSVHGSLSTLHAGVASLGQRLPAAGVWSSGWMNALGMILLGGPRAGQAEARGLDLLLCRAEGVGSRPAQQVAQGDRVRPFVFCEDAEADAWSRDFTMNGLFARREPSGEWRVYDPTGSAYDAAVQRRLAPSAPHADHVENLSMRFWKFRLRGYESSAAVRSAMRAHAREHLPNYSPTRLATLLTRLAPKRAGAPDTATFITELGRIMEADGAGRVFRTFIDTPDVRAAIVGASTT